MAEAGDLRQCGLRIVVVDDHAVVREGLVRILEGTGLGVWAAVIC